MLETPETLVLNIEVGQWRRGRFLPRITSLFQFLQDPEPELRELLTKWTRQALPPPLLSLRANANHSNWRIMACQIGTD